MWSNASRFSKTTSVPAAIVSSSGTNWEPSIVTRSSAASDSVAVAEAVGSSLGDSVASTVGVAAGGARGVPAALPVPPPRTRAAPKARRRA